MAAEAQNRLLRSIHKAALAALFVLQHKPLNPEMRSEMQRTSTCVTVKQIVVTYGTAQQAEADTLEKQVKHCIATEILITQQLIAHTLLSFVVSSFLLQLCETTPMKAVGQQLTRIQESLEPFLLRSAYAWKHLHGQSTSCSLRRAVASAR